MSKNRSNQLDRRQFVTKTSVLAGAALAAVNAPCCAALAPPTSPEANDKPWFEISLAQWSVNRMLFGGKLDNLGFPAFAKEKCGISAVEYVNQFFKDKAEDANYLEQLKTRCSDVGVRSVLIMVDGEGNIGDPDGNQRKKAVENHHRWVTAARELGCHSIRVNASSAGSYQEQVKLAADGLRQLSEFAADHDINVLVENHGGLSSNGQWLAQVIRHVDMGNCGTLPDFGNFQVSDGDYYDQGMGFAAMLPFAKSVSAKSYGFDEAGNELNTDYLKMMAMVKDAGYRGFVGVEFEGGGTPKLNANGNADGEMSELDGVRKTRDLLIRCQQELA